MAILLQLPDYARARPKTVLKNDTQYGLLFNEENNRDVYAACILLDRQVDQFIRASALTREEKRDLRYYVDMVLSCRLAKAAKPTVPDMAALIKVCVDPIDKDLLAVSVRLVLEHYRALGGTDTVAKGAALREDLVARMEQRSETDKFEDLFGPEN